MECLPALQKLFSKPAGMQIERKEIQFLACSFDAGPAMLTQIVEPLLRAASHIGQFRKANEDHYVVAEFDSAETRVHSNVPDLDPEDRMFSGHGQLMMVADGVGGSADGGYASQMALREMFKFIADFGLESASLSASDEMPVGSAFCGAVKRIQRMLQQTAEHDPSKSGMGTTLTLAYVTWPRLHILHIGDTRCYRLRDGRLEQLTTDHNLAELLSSDGKAPSAFAANNFRHVLWNSLSPPPATCEPDFQSRELKPGDALLLCSDGLTAYLNDDELSKFLAKQSFDNSACEKMIALANERGGRDNITVVTASYTERHSN